MRTRSAAVDLTWNGAAVKSKMLGQTTEITYTCLLYTSPSPRDCS